MNYVLYGCTNCGSAITECQLALAGLPYRLEEVGDAELYSGDPRLLEVNPLNQVPTLVLPSGEIMTESAAITLHLADIAPHAGLVAPAGDPLRPAFLRWLVFFGSALYATFTYGDDTSKWVSGKEAQDALRESTDAHRIELWKHVESKAGEPWFLGETFTSLDLYVAVMNRWRPRTEWFRQNAPKLAAIADRTRERPVVSQVLARHV